MAQDKATATERMEGRKAGNNTNISSSNAMPSGFGAKGSMPSNPDKGNFGTGKLSDF